MKKLIKKNNIKLQTIEAYGCIPNSCVCMGNCPAIPTHATQYEAGTNKAHTQSENKQTTPPGC